MIGSFPYPWEEPQIRCAICARRVTLELSKTDEEGNAVHEDCYVRMIIPSSGTHTDDEEGAPRGWASVLLGWALIVCPFAFTPDPTTSRP